MLATSFHAPPASGRNGALPASLAKVFAPSAIIDAGSAAAALLAPLAGLGSLLQAPRDAEIIAQDAAAEHCFLVVSGCVRTARILEDGRRQVGEFLLPGDVFGWETQGAHEFAAEAVTPVTLRRFPLVLIEERAEASPAFAQAWHRYISRQFRIMRGRLMLLGRMTAFERIAQFLLEMNGRLRGGPVIELPMGRADMADYLGLTIETVSRGLADLCAEEAITVERRRIVIRSRQRLGLAAAEQTLQAA